MPLPDAPPPPSEADLAKQPYPGVVVRLNHPDPAVVMLLQRRLNQLGCWSKVDAKGKAVPLDVDGDFGQLTRLGREAVPGTLVGQRRQGRCPSTAWSGAPPGPRCSGRPACRAGSTAAPPPQLCCSVVINVAAAEEQQHVREVAAGFEPWTSRGPVSARRRHRPEHG